MVKMAGEGLELPGQVVFFIARLFSKPADGALVHPAGLILSVIGALILLYAWGHLAR